MFGNVSVRLCIFAVTLISVFLISECSIEITVISSDNQTIYLDDHDTSPIDDSCEYGYVFNGTHCEECGDTFFQTNTKIVGGTIAVPYSWPANVLIVQSIKGDYVFPFPFGKRTISVKYQCGGTLINRNTVLTAGHCIVRKFQYQIFGFLFDLNVFLNDYYPTWGSMFQVYLGVHDIAFLRLNRSPSPPGVVRSVAKAISHELYDFDSYVNDIALLILSEPIELSPFIKLACLPPIKSNDFPSSNQSCWAAGWGKLRSDSFDIPTQLNNVKMTVYDSSNCYGVLPVFDKIWDAQICAGELKGGIDTCQGDSGGGLYILAQINNKTRYIVSGVTSYGDDCGLPDRPGIYTRVSYYVDWIREHWRVAPSNETEAPYEKTTTTPLPTSTATIVKNSTSLSSTILMNIKNANSYSIMLKPSFLGIIVLLVAIFYN